MGGRVEISAHKLAPQVISMVGTMQNLVNEVLQAVVGNYFRDTLQGMAAVQFIENRAAVQTQAQAYITEQIRKYNVETRGVYIQDVVLPAEIVTVLTQREIANQEKVTFTAQKEAQLNRIAMEKQAVSRTGDAISAGVMGFLREFQRQPGVPPSHAK